MAAVLCMGLVLGITPSSVAAYSHNGASMSANADGIGDWDMDFCFEYGTPPYNNQGAMMSGLDHWASAITHLGKYNMGTNCFGANVEIRFDAIDGAGVCARYAAAYGIGAGDTFFQIKLNSQCGPWYWGSGGAADGYIHAVSTVAHELGHGLGMGHSTQWALMHSPSACQLQGGIALMSQDDATAIQTWYPAWSKGGSWPSAAVCH